MIDTSVSPEIKYWDEPVIDSVLPLQHPRPKTLQPLSAPLKTVSYFGSTQSDLFEPERLYGLDDSTSIVIFDTEPSVYTLLKQSILENRPTVSVKLAVAEAELEVDEDFIIPFSPNRSVKIKAKIRIGGRLAPATTDTEESYID